MAHMHPFITLAWVWHLLCLSRLHCIQYLCSVALLEAVHVVVAVADLASAQWVVRGRRLGHAMMRHSFSTVSDTANIP